MGSCTNEGQAVTSVKPPRNVSVKIGSKAADAPRRTVFGQDKIGALTVYAETTGSTNQFLHLVCALCDGPIESVENIYIGNEELTLDGSGNGTGKWSGHVSAQVHLGAADQEADADLVAASAGKWTDAHRLRGIAYIYIKLENWSSAGPTDNVASAVFQGAPEISAVVLGRSDIYDPRTGITGYSDNPALCLAKYRELMGVNPIDPASITAAANVCDVIVGSRKRFIVGGTIEASASAEDVTRQFLAACSATLSSFAGELTLRVGEPGTPSMGTLTWNDVITDTVDIQRTTGTTETQVASYSGADTDYLQSDATAGTDGKNTLKLDLVANGEQAEQIAATANKEAGPSETISLATRLKFLDLAPGDTLDVDLQPHAYGRYVVGGMTTSVGIAPQITLSLTKVRTSIYDDIATTPRTAATLDVNPRQYAAPSVTATGGSPYIVHAEIAAGASARYVIYSNVVGVFLIPALETDDGLPYFGDLTIPAPTPGAATVVSVIIFRAGWKPAQGNITLF